MATSYFRTTGVTGAPQLGITTQTPSAQRKLHVFPDIYFIRPELSPFLHLSRAGMFNRISVGDPWFRQFEQPEHSYTMQVNGAVGATATGITVDTGQGAQCKVGDRLMPLDGSAGVFRITSITTDRLAGKWYLPTGVADTTTHQTVADNVYLQLLGNTSKEGSTLPDIVQPMVSSADNYIETMRHPFGGSRIRLTADMWVARGMDHLAKVEWRTAKKAIEWKLKWQVPSEQVSGSTVYRTTGGLNYWITQGSGYSKDYGGTTLSSTLFYGDIEQVFDHGSDRKILFANRRFIRRLDEMKEAKLQMRPTEMIYNLKVNWWETSLGELMVVYDKSLDQPGYTTVNLSMQGMAFIVDPEYIDYVTYQGNDIHVELDKQQPDYDGRINEYIGDIGIRVNYTQSHGIIYGVK
ncbi:MAG TPA: DUF5309 family protein [Phycisphaerae bacterium]|nr:DUF5309 family protein [Phycisphaerae bacterium]